MANPELLKVAQKSLAIQDVYLCEANVWANRAYEPGTPVLNSSVQFRVSPTNECQINELQPPQNGIRYFVRYFVGTGLRILGADVNPGDRDIPRDKMIADIEATFVVRYVVIGSDQPTPPVLEAFNENALHHIWPYWREFLQATTVRLRVPPVILPMREITKASDVVNQRPEAGSK